MIAMTTKHGWAAAAAVLLLRCFLSLAPSSLTDEVALFAWLVVRAIKQKKTTRKWFPNATLSTTCFFFWS